MSQVPSVSARATLCTTAALGARLESVFTAEHMQMRESLRKFIDTEINPHVGVATFYHTAYFLRAWYHVVVDPVLSPCRWINGRRMASFRRTSCSRKWATTASWGSPSQQSLAGWDWTTGTC